MCTSFPLYGCIHTYGCVCKMPHALERFTKSQQTMHDANMQQEKRLTLPSDVIISFLFFLLSTLLNVFMLLFPPRFESTVVFVVVAFIPFQSFFFCILLPLSVSLLLFLFAALLLTDTFAYVMDSIC